MWWIQERWARVTINENDGLSTRLRIALHYLTRTQNTSKSSSEYFMCVTKNNDVTEEQLVKIQITESNLWEL